MKRKSVIISVIAVCLAFLCLFSGCMTSESWVRRTISEYYYRFDGDYSDIENLKGLSIEDMVGKLDPYSAYYTREEYNRVLADNQGSKSGIGVAYSFVSGKGVEIHAVVGNSPAKKAGLKAGDIVVSALDGEGNITNFDSSDAFSGFVTARAEGEKFTFNLSDGRTAVLGKEQYTASYVSMFTAEKSYEVYYDDGARRIEENSEGGIPQLPAGTAYMYMYQFYGGAAEEMGELIERFNAEGCTSLILDLRDNGGGYVDLMAKIGGLFTARLDDGKDHIAMVAKFKDGSEAVEECAEYPREDVKTFPKGADLYVLANENTASASEALIGVLVSYGILDYENIFLSDYGENPPKSYGKGIMQSVFENYVTHEALKLTVAGIYWANGKTIHDRGLTLEDGCTAAPAGDRIVNVGYDDELAFAIERITAKAAS